MSDQKRFYISDANKHDGQEVVVQGWVHNKRESGKKLRFLVMRDGTGLMQGVLFKGECEPSAFDRFGELTQESAVRVRGVLRAEPRAPGGYEMGIRDVEIVSISQEYPITPKEHGVEFLMENRHLWVRSSKQWAALRVRSEIIRQIHNFFHQEGFVHFDAPILTPSACEGTSTLFSTQYFEDKAFLSQSGQLYAEVGAMAFGKCYVYGPTFRAEKSKTRKHLTEFWMVEPEMAFANLSDAMVLAERFVEHIVQTVLQNCPEELKTLERDLSKLEKVKAPFPRISYDEALELLKKSGNELEWGEDFGAPHETIIGDAFDRPVFVHHFPSKIKAFYFSHTDEVGADPKKGEGKYALGCDLIATEGYGELIGGGQREHDYDVLVQKLKAHHLDQKDYEWYLDLRRYGTNPHSGFGLGVERTVAWLTGVSHVRETIPFPRMLNTLRP